MVEFNTIARLGSRSEQPPSNVETVQPAISPGVHRRRPAGSGAQVTLVFTLLFTSLTHQTIWGLRLSVYSKSYLRFRLPATPLPDGVQD